MDVTTETAVGCCSRSGPVTERSEAHPVSKPAVSTAATPIRNSIPDFSSAAGTASGRSNLNGTLNLPTALDCARGLLRFCVAGGLPRDYLRPSSNALCPFDFSETPARHEHLETHVREGITRERGSSTSRLSQRRTGARAPGRFRGGAHQLPACLPGQSRRLAHPPQHGYRVHQDRPAGRGDPALQARA